MFSTYFTLIIVVGAIGVALAFVGWIFTVLTALGRKDYIAGVLCFTLFPVAWYYSAKHWRDDNYAARLLFSGTLLLVLSAGVSAVLYTRLNMQLIPA